MPITPHFTEGELWEFEEDARAGLLNEDGALSNPGHWLGLIIDVCRSHRATLDALAHEKQVRIHGKDPEAIFRALG